MTDRRRLALTLNDVVEDPKLAEGLSRAALADLLRRARHLVVDLESELTSRDAAASAPDATAGDDVRVLTTKQLADLWGRKEAQIRELCRTRRLPATKLGPKEWVIPVAELRARLRNCALAEGSSLGIPSAHDPNRAPDAPAPPRRYTVEVRRPAGREPHHAREVGDGNAGHERHDPAPPARGRRARRPRPRAAHPADGGPGRGTSKELT